MRYLFIIASLATLAGCATQQPTAYNTPADPREWRTVSVTNVDLPPGAPRPDNYTSRYLDTVPAPSGNSVTYSSAGSVPVYTYGPGVYTTAPVVVQPYYNQPQVSIGLGFGIGRHGFLGINQHFGGYPYAAPYGYWPHSSFILRSAPRHHHHWRRHDGRRAHDGYRRGDGRRGHR